LDTSTLEIELANIVVLFEDLTDRDISRDKLRAVLPNAAPQVLEVPGFTQVSYPSLDADIVILWADQARFEAKILNPREESWALLSKLATSGMKSIKRAKQTHFGFNIFSVIQVNPSANELLLTYFNAPITSVNKHIEGQLTGMNFTLNYQQNGVKYQLGVIPDAKVESRLSVRLNAEFASSEFPKLDSLSGLFAEFRDNYTTLVRQLFEDM